MFFLPNIFDYKIWLILKIVQMLPHQKSNKNLYTAQNHHISQPQSHNKKNFSPQQAVKTIFSILQKISNQNKRSSLKSFSQSQRTLFSTISSLLASLDNEFESSSLNLDMIIEIFKTIGYGGNLKKNNFQPVGAPHTWNNCLMMMEWLAQIAQYHFQFRLQQSQDNSQQSVNDIILKAYVEDNPQLVEKYYIHKTKQAREQIQNLKYANQSHKLALQNLHKYQKDLKLVQAEQLKNQKILEHQKQLVLKYDRNNQQIRKQIKKVIQEQDQIAHNINIADREIQSLKNKIENQELTVQQVQQLGIEIRQFQGKILDQNQRHNQKMQQLNNFKHKLIQKFGELERLIQKFNCQAQKIQKKTQQKQYKIKLPLFNKLQFINYVNLKDSNHIQSWNKTKHQINRIFQKQPQLLRLFKIDLEQALKQRNQLLERSNQLQIQLQNDEKRLNDIIISLKQKKIQYEEMIIEDKNLEKRIEVLKKNNQQIENKNKIAVEKINNMKMRMQTLSVQMSEAVEFRAELQKQVQKSLQIQKKSFQDWQENYRNLLKNQKQSFDDINQQLKMITSQQQPNKNTNIYEKK